MTRRSQQWTAVSSFLELVSTVQRRYVTPAQEPTHINCKMTRSLYQVPYFESRAPKHALPHHVFRGARRQSVTIVVSKSTSSHIYFLLFETAIAPKRFKAIKKFILLIKFHGCETGAERGKW